MLKKFEDKELFLATYLDLVRLGHARNMIGAGQSIFRVAGQFEVARELIDLWRYVKPQEPPPPPPQLDKIELDTGYITFGGGVPVGGYSHLSLFPDGAYSFTGHFHDSGWPSYDTSLVWAVGSASGSVFTFSHKGRVHGTGESGSRDDDWGDSGTNPAIAAAWADLSAGYSYQWRAGVNIDIGAIADSAVKAIGAVATVIAII
jgi:hypothetical protein